MEVLEMVVALILIVFAIKGMKQGLILTVCSIVTLFIAIAVTHVLSPQISSMVKKNENIVNYISEKVEDVLFEKNSNKGRTQEQKIEALSIPKVLKRDIVENNKKSSYEQMGAANFQEYTSIYITYSIINSVCYVAIFLVSLLVLKLIAHALNLISMLPVIHTLNKLGGLGVGLAEGIICVWIGFVIISIFCSAGFAKVIVKQINNSVWLSYLYDNNVILNTVSHVADTIF